MISDYGFFRCAKCSRSYQYKRSLINHLRFECGVEPKFKCNNCSYRCKIKGNLTKHILRCHKKNKILNQSSQLDKWKCFRKLRTKYNTVKIKSEILGFWLFFCRRKSPNVQNKSFSDCCNGPHIFNFNFIWYREQSPFRSECILKEFVIGPLTHVWVLFLEDKVELTLGFARKRYRWINSRIFPYQPTPLKLLLISFNISWIQCLPHPDFRPLH